MAIQGFNPTSRQRGFIKVECEHVVYFLRLAEHDALMAALDRGDVWFAGIDNFGVKCRFRLAPVMGVESSTPEAIAAGIAELEAGATEDKERAGDDDGERWKHGRRQ